MDFNTNFTSAYETSQLTAAQQSVGSLQRGLKNHENKTELMKTARQFEGLMLQQLMKSMEKTVNRSDLFGNSHAEGMYRDMLYEQISTNAAESQGPGLGIAQMIYKQLAPYVNDPHGTG
ncbi:MAG: rod-binding protein [Cyanobacteria bacterium HKST-UBA06]|nr:rod-binding protein [Cyanobacteria bacterium HKST-UBA06]